MSATAFQKLRREAAATMANRHEEVKKPEETHVLTNKEMMAILDEKGIEYDKKANKTELTKLLEGAE